MARVPAKREPTFLWQGVLITLPMVVLAILGGLSLRRDQALAAHDAAERAQVIAGDLGPKISAELTSPGRPGHAEPLVFEMDAAGKLVEPPPCSPTPVPLDPGQLSPGQRELWEAAQQAEAEGKGTAAVVAAYENFAKSNPPRNFIAAAQFTCGLLLAREKEFQAAAERFELLLEDYSDAIGETGLPLRPLAQMKLFEMKSHLALSRQEELTVGILCSNLVCQPGPLTSRLLNQLLPQATTPAERAEVLKWQLIWDRAEDTRELFAAAREQFPYVGRDWSGTTWFNGPVPVLFWFSTPAAVVDPAAGVGGVQTSDLILDSISARNPGHHWLAFELSTLPPEAADRWKAYISRSAQPPTVSAARGIIERQSAMLVPPPRPPDRFACLSESAVNARVYEVIENASQIPEYFGIGVEISGQRIGWPVTDLRAWHYYHYGGKTGGERKEYSGEIASNILATASVPLAGVDGVKVSVFLTSPATLYERQRARTFWFGALIATAAVAAIIGLVAAYRAFQRQIRLGEMKSNFVSSVSHELRAPIASVRLLAESLERGKVADAPKQQEYFRFIVQECRRLSSLIENVLDFSRIEQGRKEYDFEPTDLMALTEQTVKPMQNYAEERQVHLSMSGPEPRPECELELDGKAMQQALVNLIDNAIKHSPKGETVTVGVEIRSAECGVRNVEAGVQNGASSEEYPSSILHPPSSIVQLWVEDHGEGIPPTEHEKIFERFYRRGSELRRETSGVGIGLSIVKHIVEAHGGRVLVRSDVGKGSRFTIELPISNNEGTKERRGSL
jgi:signal transduction histidine kinase